MELIIIAITLVVVVVMVIVILFPPYNNTIIKPPATKEEFFLDKTDKLWEGACRQYGSFDKIPEERKRQIYLIMKKIANELNYDGFKIENYIKD